MLQHPEKSYTVVCFQLCGNSLGKKYRVVRLYTFPPCKFLTLLHVSSSQGGMMLTYDPTPALQNGWAYASAGRYTNANSAFSVRWRRSIYHDYRDNAVTMACVYTCVCLPLQVLLVSLLHCSQQNDHASLCLSVHAFPRFNIPGPDCFHASHIRLFKNFLVLILVLRGAQAIFGASSKCIAC